MLLIDEVGYLKMDSVAATLFFQLVSARYERGSIVLTSNKSFGEWAEIFGDPVIATAILDRLLHHSHVPGKAKGRATRLRKQGGGAGQVRARGGEFYTAEIGEK